MDSKIQKFAEENNLTYEQARDILTVQSWEKETERRAPPNREQRRKAKKEIGKKDWSKLQQQYGIARKAGYEYILNKLKELNEKQE